MNNLPAMVLDFSRPCSVCGLMEVAASLVHKQDPRVRLDLCRKHYETAVKWAPPGWEQGQA